MQIRQWVDHMFCLDSNEVIQGGLAISNYFSQVNVHLFSTHQQSALACFPAPTQSSYRPRHPVIKDRYKMNHLASYGNT